MSNTITEAVPDAVTSTTPTPTATAATPDPVLVEKAKVMIDKLMADRNPGMQEYLDIKMFSDHIVATVNGLERKISLSDFVRRMGQMIDTDTTGGGEILALPYGCFSMSQSATHIRVSCYYPERKAMVEFIGGGKFNIILPNIIITHMLEKRENDWHLQNSRFMCTDKKVPELSVGEMITAPNQASRIWRMPLPNFYSDGKMCFGDNHGLGNLGKNLRALDYYYSLIFESPFNGDLGLGEIVHPTTRNLFSHVDWLRYLSTLDKFPYQCIDGSLRGR